MTFKYFKQLFNALNEKKCKLFISNFGYFGIVITEDDETYVFGDNEYGQLGVGDNVIRKTPTLLKCPNGKWMDIKINDEQQRI